MLISAKILHLTRLIRLLTYTPLPVHIALVIVIPLLRLPTFHPEFFLLEESQLMITAQKILAGGSIYADAWHAGPPIMVWIYSIFSLAFGSVALTAIRIFTCLYIYFSAIVFNGILAEYKAFRRNAGLISMLFALLVCTPWYSLQFNASLFVLLPVVLTFSHVNQLVDRSPANRGHLYVAGIWMMMAILASYKTTFLLAGVLLAYLVLHPFSWSEVMSFVGGLVTVLGLALLWLFRQGAIHDWWDQGVLYYVDYLGLTGEMGYSASSESALLILLLSWGSFLIMAIVGFIHYRLYFYKYVKKARSAETMMLIWMLGVLLILLFKIRRLEMPDFILLVPPLAFYIAKTFDFRIFTRFRVPVLIALLFLPLLQYSSYLGMVFSDSMPILTVNQSVLQTGGLHLDQQKHEQILARTAVLAPEEKIWVMANEPDIYLRSKRIPAVAYLDFRMAYHKLQDLPGHEGKLMISSITPSREVFRTFAANPPALVLDAGNFFPPLQSRFPSVFGRYKAERIGTWTVYSPVRN